MRGFVESYNFFVYKYWRRMTSINICLCWHEAFHYCSINPSNIAASRLFLYYVIMYGVSRIYHSYTRKTMVELRFDSTSCSHRHILVLKHFHSDLTVWLGCTHYSKSLGRFQNQSFVFSKWRLSLPHWLSLFQEFEGKIIHKFWKFIFSNL